MFETIITIIAVILTSIYLAFYRQINKTSIDVHLSPRYRAVELMRAIIIAIAMMMFMGLNVPAWVLTAVTCLTIGFCLSAWHTLLKY